MLRKIECSVVLVTSPTQSDPIVEYEDEFGRIRTARRSEVPRNLVPDANEEEDEDECVV